MITIAAFTSRKEPCFNWMVDALANQTTQEEREKIQLILIDRLLWFPSLFQGAAAHTEWIDLRDPQYHDPSRLQYGLDCVKGRFPFLHLPPKPCVWQGPWRLTSKDWFCAGNARNTAFLFAQHPYVVCIDDLAVPVPGWFNQVKHAAESGYVVCGAYKKVKDLVVENGNIVSYTPFPPGVDSRWARGSDDGIVKWVGAGLYGCSFGVPLDLALKVDGNDPACSALGAEDTDLGMRLERAGGEVKYNRNMLTLESEERHYLDATLPRESREVTNPEMLPNGYTGSLMSDHVLLNRLRRESTRIKPLLNETVYFQTLVQQREKLIADGVVNVPREPVTSWIDLKPLRDL